MRNFILGGLVNKAQEAFGQVARTVDNLITQPRTPRVAQNADNLNISNNLSVADNIGTVGNGAIEVPLTPAQRGAETRKANRLAKQQEADRLAEIEREANRPRSKYEEAAEIEMAKDKARIAEENRPRDKYEEAAEMEIAREKQAAANVAGTPNSEKPGNIVDHVIGDTTKATKGFFRSLSPEDSKSSKLWAQSETNSKNAKELRAAGKAEGMTPEGKAVLDSAADREWLDGVENKFKAGGSWITGDGSFPLGAVRVAGAYAAVDVTGRALGGGTLTTDSNGKQNIAGVPFI